MKIIFNKKAEQEPEELRRAGIRLTKPRRQIMEALARSGHCLTPEELFREVGRASVGLTTVYRTLDLLSSLGMVSRIETGEGIARYRLICQGRGNPVELVCRRCFSVWRPEAGSPDPLEEWRREYEKESGFRIFTETITIFGLCPECRAKTGQGTKNKNKEKRMKAAIATDGTQVAAHFGRCGHYTLAVIEEGQLKDRVLVENPGHAPGAIPRFLADHGAELVVAGGMGPRAQQIFAAEGIDWMVGVSGTVDAAVEALCTGELKGGQSLCTGHSDGNGVHGGNATGEHCGGH